MELNVKIIVMQLFNHGIIINISYNNSVIYVINHGFVNSFVIVNNLNIIAVNVSHLKIIKSAIVTNHSKKYPTFIGSNACNVVLQLIILLAVNPVIILYVTTVTIMVINIFSTNKKMLIPFVINYNKNSKKIQNLH